MVNIITDFIDLKHFVLRSHDTVMYTGLSRDLDLNRTLNN